MVSLAQYAGFSDMGKALKSVALASAIATLVVPISVPVSSIIMSYTMSSAFAFFGGDFEALHLFQNNCLVAMWVIIGSVIGFFFMAILFYKIKMFKALKVTGERQGNADLTALAKHYLIELVLTLIVAPLFAVTAIMSMASTFLPVPFLYSGGGLGLMLANWFAIVLDGMYSIVDGFKKWEPVGRTLTSYKGRAGMMHMNASFGVGLAIFIISHYVMIYLVSAVGAVSACTGDMYPAPYFCTTLGFMSVILIPVGVAMGILSLIGVINHIKGLFRVGNTFIELEEGRVSTSPYGGTYYRPQQVDPYSAQANYGAPATGGGYQHGTWSAPRYSQAMQPVQPVQPVQPIQPVQPNQPAYRDTSAIQQGWNIDNASAASPAAARTGARCKSCQAALPEHEDVSFCPYCGAPI